MTLLRNSCYRQLAGCLAVILVCAGTGKAADPVSTRQSAIFSAKPDSPTRVAARQYPAPVAPSEPDSRLSFSAETSTTGLGNGISLDETMPSEMPANTSSSQWLSDQPIMGRESVENPHAGNDAWAPMGDCYEYPCDCLPCESCLCPIPLPFSPWKPLFFDNDFSEKALCGQPPLIGERTKGIPLDFDGPARCLGDAWISFGGEFRSRYMVERNRLRPDGPGRSSYHLTRLRNYLDLQFASGMRVYFETIDAGIFHEDLPATGIDLNRMDILNEFVDLNYSETGEPPVTFRIGRQELLYGKERLISPLDWANTRRNFQGIKVFRHGEFWDIDGFATRPVNTATGHGPLDRFDHERDTADTSRTFNGVYATYRGWDRQVLDLYWIWLTDQDPMPGLADGNRHTIGLRWHKTQPADEWCQEATGCWVFDVEGAYQFGRDNSQTVEAGFATTALTRSWPTELWQPELTFLYYWGSGDHDPHDDENNTFSVLFPLGHAYWGLIDNLAGQNLKDYSIQFSMRPVQKLTLAGALHWFDLDRGTDVLYTVSGAPLGVPGTGKEVGEEMDVLASYYFNPNFQLQAAYFWFWNGTFIQNNAPRHTAKEFFVQSTFRY